MDAFPNFTIEGQYAEASNSTFLCRTQDGERVIYKPIRGERPLWDFPNGTLAGRERSAYLISEALDFDIVPYTTIQEGPLGMGMVQRWIDTLPLEADDVIELGTSDHPDLQSIALFDALINNTDRKFSHLLFTSKRIYGCDHGVTFHEEDKLRTVLWQFEGETIPSSLLDKLSTLSLNDEIYEYLTSIEILALTKRKNILLSEKRFPHPNPNWPAVPWPIM